MFEIGLFEETVGHSGDDLMFAINIPQESVTIPETIDAIRAAMPMQKVQAEAVALTNRYLGMK
jgi:glyceraldehyde-3-phosphate dehydrogenase (NAD(P))